MPQSPIKVAVRVRPPTSPQRKKRSSTKLPNGKSDQPQNLIHVQDSLLILDQPENKLNLPSQHLRQHKFCYDSVFGPECTQEQLFDKTVKPLISSLVDGYNATIFAYGATGCGKTHTISGPKESPGVIYLATQELFAQLENQKLNRKFKLFLSYLEVYNERIRDLLSPFPESRADLKLREDNHSSIVVTNLSFHEPTNPDEVRELVEKGSSRRTQSSTFANAVSSRSHAVLQIKLVQTDHSSGLEDDQLVSTLSIIDLAGSERAAATKNCGKQLREGAHINKSLLALGNCINALSTKKSFIPYRNSKLTRLLKFSLGGNCRTLMIACVSPSARHYDDTLKTLRYAAQAKEIRTSSLRNHQLVNNQVANYVEKIDEQRRNIVDLKAQLMKWQEVWKLARQASEYGKDLAEAEFRKLLTDYGQAPYHSQEGELALQQAFDAEKYKTLYNQTLNLNQEYWNRENLLTSPAKRIKPGILPKSISPLRVRYEDSTINSTINMSIDS